VATAVAPSQARTSTSDVSEYRWLILLGLITAAIMEVLDTTIVNVALPQMAGNLGATRDEIGWVATGYILSNVVVLPLTAFFTARFGRKNYLSASILIFAGASFMCGTSHSLVELVVWRVVQGAGGAALLSTAQATLRQVFPREQQGLVQAVFLLGIIVAPTLGPTLGGWITDNYTWSWCFFINIPIGLVSAFLVFTFLHDPPEMRRRAGRVDFFGIGEHHTGDFPMPAGDVVIGTFEYATDLYDRSTAERMVAHFQHLLESVVADPNRPICDLDLSSDAERHQVLVGWNETRAPFPDMCIHELFEAQGVFLP